MLLIKKKIGPILQLFAWQTFLKLWKEYTASWSKSRLIRRTRLFLDVADYYLINPKGISAAPIRAERLYRHALRQMWLFANEKHIYLPPGDSTTSANQAHQAFNQLILPRKHFWNAIYIYMLTAWVGGGVGILLLSAFSTNIRGWIFPVDRAADGVWRISETAAPYPGTGVMPNPKDPSNPFFFHTKEMDNPWLDIDLGRKKKISVVQVQNRRDCCFERALPLEILISVDGRTWKTVSRRRGTFTYWEAEFSTVLARYVRLTTPRRTMLHLAAVSIY